MELTLLAVNTRGKTIFRGAVGAVTALNSLATDGPKSQTDQVPGEQTQLGGNVTTSGAQTFGDPVILLANVRADSTRGKTITFGSTVDALASGQESLTVNTTGDEIFSGKVGASLGADGKAGTADDGTLKSLTTDDPSDSVTSKAGGSAFLNGGVVKTTGEQHYHDNVAMKPAGDLELDAGATITIDGSLEGLDSAGTSVGLNSLTVTAPKTIINGDFGALPDKGLTRLTFNGHVQFTASGHKNVFEVNPLNSIPTAKDDSGDWGINVFIFNGFDGQIYTHVGAFAPQEDLWRRILGAALARPGGKERARDVKNSSQPRPKLPPGNNKGSGDSDAQ